LALRKRFCVTFDFELQAAANDDAVILSLGPQHSFPLPSAARLLHPNKVRATLEQAVLASPMFTSRWRWDLSRALAILRFRGGKKNPLPVQRMEADDLMAAIFPALAACQENTPPGPIQLPDHVIVRQVLHDCLHEAMDVDGLSELVAGVHSGRIKAHFVDSVEPSVLSHEIVNSEPYTFLDDAPLEERRARQVQLRRGLPVEARDLSRLDPAALERVRAEVAPAPRGREELHELLVTTLVQQPREDWVPWFEELRSAGRSMEVRSASQQGAVPQLMWCSTERRAWAEALFPGAQFMPDYDLPSPAGSGAGDASGAGDTSGASDAGDTSGAGDAGDTSGAAVDEDAAAAAAVRGHLGLTGPVTVAALAGQSGLAPSRVSVALARLEAEGFAMQGRFDPALGDEEQWCARHLLARAHSYTQHRQRREIKAVSAQEFMRFLVRWQHAAPGTQRQGRAGVLAVIEQLQGWELAAGAWEESVLPARVEGYQRRWLEDLCLSGEVSWGRLSLRPPALEGAGRRGASTPSRATPVTFTLRADLPWLLRAKRATTAPEEPAHGPAREVLDVLRAHGAVFASDLPAATRRLPEEVQVGLWDLVARGLVTADGFAAVRSLFSRRDDWSRRHLPDRRRLGLRPNPAARIAVRQPGGGRWSLLASQAPVLGMPGAGAPADAVAGGAAGPAQDPRRGRSTTTAGTAALATDELAEQVASQLLARWGVVFWDLAAHEDFSVPWREILWALRRFEARGIARGGRFVTGFAGEQYALPEALDEIRHVTRSERKGELVRLSAADPLNLTGVILPGRRIAALRANTIVLRDGLVAAPGGREESEGAGARAMVT
ncbi:MAG TPA: hypothetical protein VME46_13450, partial [Acidimicrobiales bacterium]|nr:hypothetical protein [Acidimicrobiales bacterium]